MCLDGWFLGKYMKDALGDCLFLSQIPTSIVSAPHQTNYCIPGYGLMLDHLRPVDTLVKVLSRYPMTYCMSWKAFLLTISLHFIPLPKGMGKVWFIYCRDVLLLSHVPRTNNISVLLNIKYLDLTSSFHSTWISIQAWKCQTPAWSHGQLWVGSEVTLLEISQRQKNSFLRFMVQ